ncbi:hypothetical protein BBO99_00007989 [Phytophthora kernoviae]|uniref:GxxExxY protein n=1 Tax=Phytophthora kernoviae TaxID=325452 RepID=A0A3R7GIS1_9STRA|nr:hypothetical protein JM16_008306 [Phytophthora kernoviae]RLN06187.1 hypothetical protein BBI17_007940 [Phytophthora kernoviae]RLN75877.1 hypothetical protein BBO99_00007989 [Phytophthora kernoviae]
MLEIHNDVKLQQPIKNVSEFWNGLNKLVIQVSHNDVELRESIKGAVAFEKEIMGLVKHVYTMLGSEQSEGTYQKLLRTEICKRNIVCKEEVEIPIMYDGERLGSRRADLIVELHDGTVYILELKHVKALTQENLRQLKYYMEQFKIPQGMLINFPKIESSFPDVSDEIKDNFEHEELLGTYPEEKKAKTKTDSPILTIISLKNSLISKDLSTH